MPIGLLICSVILALIIYNCIEITSRKTGKPSNVLRIIFSLSAGYVVSAIGYMLIAILS